MPARVLRLSGLAVLASLLLAASAGAAPTIDGEFVIPSGFESNNKIAAGPDGNMWMTLSAANKDVARITPAGEVTEFDLQIEGTQGITADAGGLLWVTRNGGVTKFDPADPEGTKESTLVEPINGSPIVLGPDGNLWAAALEKLVRIPPGDPGSAKSFTAPWQGPKDIDVAGSLLAVADFNGQQIVTATPQDPPAFVEYAISGGSQGVAGSPEGQIAFSDADASPQKVGRITPPNPAQETELGGDPFGVAFGTDGAFWIAQTAKHSVARLTTEGQISELPGFDANLGPRQIAAGPGNTLWVTLEDFNNLEVPEKVARVSGVEKPPSGTVKPPPETKINRSPKKKVKTRRKRARVKFRFSSDTPGATFECALTKLRKKGKRQPRPRYRACRSPKVYRVKPGRYRFQVRAVFEGVADPTPAKRLFKVVRKKR